MKRTVCIIICLLLLGSVSVSATGDYSESYSDFSLDKIDELISPEIKSKLQSDGLDPEDENWISNLEIKDVFSYIFSLFKGGMKRPFKALFTVIGICLVTVCAECFTESDALPYISAAATLLALIVTGDLWQTVVSGVDEVKMCADFMLGFVPIFAVLTASSGKTLTAAASSGALLLCAQFVSYLAGYIVLPLMGGYFAVSVTSEISPLIKSAGLPKTLKKLSLWILGISSTVFLGVLGIQSAVNSAADNLAIKTTKFILGSTVPAVGSALSEAVSATASSISLLRSSIGIYAVVVLGAMLIPVIVNLLIWRGIFLVLNTVCSLFGEKSAVSVFSAADAVVACAFGVVVFVFSVFTISLGVVISAGGTV